MAYDAFISYSHSADLDLAPVIRDGLQRLAKPWHKRRALSIFLDQASLELSSELGGSLDERIEDTRWLVLFMSEQSAQSRWVGEEIALWAAKKSKQHIALVLTSGEVVWDDVAKDFDYERSTAVSEGMRGVYTGQDSEPLFLDLRWSKALTEGEKPLDLNHLKFRDAIATLAAPIHGMPKDELEGEDVRQYKLFRRLRRAAVSGLVMLTVLAVGAGIFARDQRDEAIVQRAEAIVQRDRSEARRLATVAKANAAEQTDLALLLALESLKTAKTDDGWGALFTALSQPVMARSPLIGHTAGVNRLLFSPDGSVLATMGGDGIVGLWDSTDPAVMRQIDTLEGHAGDGNIWEAAFNPDGSMLATPGSDWTVRLWNVNSGVQLGEPLKGHIGAVWDVAFNPDGTMLATASADSTVRLWDLEGREQLVVENMGTEEDRIQVWEVEFSADGSTLLWVSSDGSLRSRLVVASSEVETLLTGHDEWTQGSTLPGIAFSHDRMKLAVASGDWRVQVWDLTSNKPTLLHSLMGHDGFVVDLAFSRDDKQLASASQNRTVRTWNVASGKQLGNTLTGHDAGVFSVGFSPDGKMLASGSADGRLRGWDLGAGGRVGRQLDHGKSVLGVSVSPDGKVAASAGMDSKISLWNIASGKPLGGPLKSHAGEWVTSVTFSPDAKLLASTGNDNMVRLWHTGSGLPADVPLAGHQDWVLAAVFSPDGTMLASADYDGMVLLWNLGSGEQVALKGHKDAVRTLVFSPDGYMLASASETTVRVWEVGTGKQSGDELAGHDDIVLDVRFLPDDKHLLSASSDGVVLRWDLLTRVAEKMVDAETEWTAAAFSDDGARMASAAPDGRVRLWDLALGTQVGVVLLGHSKSVEGLDFSPDGALVASASQDGSVRLWPAEDRWRTLACAAVGRNLSMGEWKEFVDAERSYRKQCPPPRPVDAPRP